MESVRFAEAVQSSLHAVAHVLLVPVMVVLVLLVMYAIYQVGTLIAEYLSEHRKLEVSMPELMDGIDAACLVDLPLVIGESGLLARQREALLTLVAHAQLPLDDLVALARKLSFAERQQRAKVVGRTDFVAKVSPMFGLMGTLIPLGPGIIALSSGDTASLSNALLVAFDTTTAGLVVAAVALGVSKFRLRWYARYASDLDAAMTAVVRRIRDCDGEERLGGLRAARAALGVQGASGLGAGEPADRPSTASASLPGSGSAKGGAR